MWVAGHSIWKLLLLLHKTEIFEIGQLSIELRYFDEKTSEVDEKLAECEAERFKCKIYCLDHRSGERKSQSDLRFIDNGQKRTAL